MEPDLQDIRDNYAKFDDWKIEKLATEDPASLRPEVLEILKQEIEKRGLNPGLISSVDIKTREISHEEMNEYFDMVRNHPCPTCGSRTAKLNASVTGTAMSFILFTSYEKSLRVACKYCLDKEHSCAVLKTGLLGWWGFPWGPIRTIQSFIFNSKRKREYHENRISPTMAAFVTQNIGNLEVAKVNPSQLEDLLKHVNKQ